MPPPGSAKNLIVNGDAEAGPGALDFDDVFPVPGWTTTGAFTAVQYASPDVSVPIGNEPAPPNRGANLFAGGPDSENSSAFQLIDVSASTSLIDVGNVPYFLTGYLGGYSFQNDTAVLTATFQGAGGLTLGSASIGPVTNVDRDIQTALLFRSASGLVPIGTRTINVELLMNYSDGGYNNGYADNLSLIVNIPNPPDQPGAIPEPGTCVLVASGILLLVGHVRRRAGSSVERHGAGPVQTSRR